MSDIKVIFLEKSCSMPNLEAIYKVILKQINYKQESRGRLVS